MKWLKNWFNRTSAQAARRSKSIRPSVEALEDRRVPTVQFYGGNVLPKVEAQALYLGNQWSASANSAMKTTIDSYLTDITGGVVVVGRSSTGVFR